MINEPRNHSKRIVLLPPLGKIQLFEFFEPYEQDLVTIFCDQLRPFIPQVIIVLMH